MNNIEKPANASLTSILPRIRGAYREKYDLSKITWFNVGGEAEVLFRPADADDLCHFLKNKPKSVEITMLGVCSNVLIRDGGIDGVVIRLGKGFTEIKCQGDEIHAGAGALSFNVAMVCQHNSLEGLEFLSGIPGTIGGALFMNAGAYGNDVASTLIYAEAVDEEGNKLKLSPSDIGYVYRGNTLPEGIIFTKAVFKGKHGNANLIKERINEITKKREETQPIKTRTGGSTFKNPDGKKAWQLIDEAGCRGMVHGGAKVSDLHCNFFNNIGNATSQDIEELGEIVREKVLEQSGIELQWEIKRIGKHKKKS